MQGVVWSNQALADLCDSYAWDSRLQRTPSLFPGLNFVRPVTGRNSGERRYRVEGRLNNEKLISRTRCRICREKGHWARECPNEGKQVPRE